MARSRLPQHQDLLVDVWTISAVREDVERLLEHVVRLQSEAIALAAAYGAKQPELATLAKVSRQRIGQLVDQVDVSALSTTSIHRQVHQVEEWPQDVMGALRELAHPRDEDDHEAREVTRRQTAVVYGREEADRRHDGRSAFLASLAADAEARALLEQSAARARRKVFGDEDAGRRMLTGADGRGSHG